MVHLGDFIVGRGKLEPGWRWSNDWRPIMGTTSCQVPHTGIVVSGQWHFEMDDGTAFDLASGDAYSIPPGHDAWVVGDDPVRTIDWAPCGDEARNKLNDTAVAFAKERAVS